LPTEKKKKIENMGPFNLKEGLLDYLLLILFPGKKWFYKREIFLALCGKKRLCGKNKSLHSASELFFFFYIHIILSYLNLKKKIKLHKLKLTNLA
jgi:hypothetical protein